MSKRLLHTPEGVRDIYGKEYAKKLYIENKNNKNRIKIRYMIPFFVF